MRGSTKRKRESVVVVCIHIHLGTQIGWAVFSKLDFSRYHFKLLHVYISSEWAYLACKHPRGVCSFINHIHTCTQSRLISPINILHTHTTHDRTCDAGCTPSWCILCGGGEGMVTPSAPTLIGCPTSIWWGCTPSDPRRIMTPTRYSVVDMLVWFRFGVNKMGGVQMLI